MAYKHHKSRILIGHHSYAYRPCPLCIMYDTVLSAHVRVHVGKGRRHHNNNYVNNADIDRWQGVRGVCALRAVVKTSNDDFCLRLLKVTHHKISR